MRIEVIDSKPVASGLGGSNWLPPEKRKRRSLDKLIEFTRQAF